MKKDDDCALAIRIVRRRHDLSGAELGRLLGVGQALVSKYELGDVGTPGHFALLQLIAMSEGRERSLFEKLLGGRPACTAEMGPGAARVDGVKKWRRAPRKGTK